MIFKLNTADFALVRIIGHPQTKFTSEVITLWYRPPEILMGQKNYSGNIEINNFDKIPIILIYSFLGICSFC